MQSRILLTLAAAALVCLATPALSQQPGDKIAPGRKGTFVGGSFVSPGNIGGWLTLVSSPAVQKELELSDQQLAAIQKLRDELRARSTQNRKQQ